MHSTSLEQLGWSTVAHAWSPEPDRFPVRVSSQQRGLLHVRSEHGTHPALLRGNLIDDPPVVGDWVAARWIGDQVLIEAIVPRHTCLQRRRVAGGPPQILAANVDCVAAVASLDRDFNPRRLERYEAAARGAGCEIRFVLTKLDCVDDATPFVERLHTEPILVSAHDGTGVQALRAWIGLRTAVLIGSSGVGKSTLINALLGTEERLTSATSAGHGKGRHTTTTRDLLVLPGGGCVIDTPGMREFGLAEDADAEHAFDDIQALAERCGFRDCTHRNEPDCAVLDAEADGSLDPGRLANYRKLVKELAYERRSSDKRLAAEERRNWTRQIRAVQNLRKKRGY